MKKHTILCLDDEIDNVDALERIFRKKYRVIKSTTGPDALQKLANHDISVIISDQRMPQMLGTEFLKQAKVIQPLALRILLTGYSDIEAVIEAINSGEVYRYLTKPWEPVDLLQTVDQAVEKIELQNKLELKNQELKLAYDELKTLDKAKMDFMYLVNHELKTPLTVIISFIELLLESSLDEEQSLYADKIIKSCFRLKKLIEDVLEIVSAETGKTKITLSNFDNNTLKKELNTLIVNEFSEDKKSIKMNIDDFQLKSDKKICLEVLKRLLDNALKFKSSGTVQINVFKKDNNHKVIFQMTNNGSALSKEKINHLLQPFTLDEDIMNHTSGTGMGLSISQALLKLLSSDLSISNINNKISVEFEL